jgi:hypothetical protein
VFAEFRRIVYYLPHPVDDPEGWRPRWTEAQKIVA